MLPVLTVAEMGRVDAAAPEPVEVLVERAGRAVARAAIAQMGGAYGRRVVVVAGKGNNGADGRAAAARLRRRGVRVLVLDTGDAPARLPACDLVIDAAYGTGFRGSYDAPDPGDAPVLAVDIPSGVDGDSGRASPGAVRAASTVTFPALKPGLLLADGPERAGKVTVADIGLDVSAATAHVVEDADVVAWLPPRPRDTNKWKRAVYVVAGSGGMLGAALLASHGASRAGAGMVRLYSPGAAADAFPASEVVAAAVPAAGWCEAVLAEIDRAHAVVVGPGLGRQGETTDEVRRFIEQVPAPLVIDADGLFALGEDGEVTSHLASRRAPTVLTPHEGEFAHLTGAGPGPDRLRAVRDAAARFGATILLKGSTTVVADPKGSVLMSASGGPALATAGTGDVLSGILGAFLAAGVPPLSAAAAAAHVHGRAAALGLRQGLVATDLPELVARWLSDQAGTQR